jgi:uridine kinase
MDTIIVSFEDGTKKEFRKGVKLSEVIKEVRSESEFDVICASYRNEIIFGDDSLVKSGNLQFLDINTKDGNKIYERGLLFLFEVAIVSLLGEGTRVKVKHSVEGGVYCEINKSITKDNLKELKSKMNELVANGVPFVKIETSRLEAINYFNNIKRKDKVKTLSYSTSEFVTLYKFNGFYNYILGELPQDASVLKYFDFTLLNDNGVVVRFPSMYDNGKINKYVHHEKYFNTLEEYSKWGSLLKLENLGELNESIINNNASEIVQLSETIQNYKLLSIAEEIYLNKDNIKIVLLSGPSSSGKTTTARKLSLYLKALGLNPFPLSIDDYFVEREDTPLDENGKPDYESVRAIDVKLFNSQVSKLLKGSKVTIPTFNFVTGSKEYKRTIQMNENDILIIEGLHALNEELTSDINKKNKFKIYISPLTFLNMDDDNRISMTDIRLLRRIVRDSRTRGYSPSHTLSTWADVRKGEQKYVFPYQDSDSVVFNSALVYELGVLKTYVEPLLFSVKEDDPQYNTARRLLELLKFVLPIPSDDVPNISILREFIGGSYFER